MAAYYKYANLCTYCPFFFDMIFFIAVWIELENQRSFHRISIVCITVGNYYSDEGFFEK
jgi:hypothetical protein